jgi:uncharacterized protein YyaL (SSP411 family)
VANRLINETSPYLLQHAQNPVDWYPWGEEALGLARAEDKPILLSIGYSACHWCHVMEHESFEDEATAALMNERFVSIKVDREERPDLDQIYMMAVQGMTGSGGWPMTVFLTPDGKPFYGGTYFPPTDRQGMPSFRRVLVAISDAYEQRRGEIAEQSEKITQFVQQHTLLAAPSDELDDSIMRQAFDSLIQEFDQDEGGFGKAPKFPQAMALDFLLRFHHRTGEQAALEMVDVSLRKMAHGGIYDQIGGGFHRYSVDNRWLVPHFEKMLYDNALLARAYLRAYQVTEELGYRRVVEETLDWLVREMRDRNGGFYSTLDADSEGEEGKFYVWTPTQLNAVAGPDAAALRRYYGVTDRGNFEGTTILTSPEDPEAVAKELGISLAQLAAAVSQIQPKMLEVRSQRVWPGRDEKILTAWNGLMLRTLAEAARVLGRPSDLEAAISNAEFLTGEMWRDGRLYRIHKDGETKIPGFLEDYASVADALLALYETTFDLRWYKAAREIADTMIDLFWDEDAGTFFDAARDAEALVARPRDIFDNATPSGASQATHALICLWALTGEDRYERLARQVLASLAGAMRASGVGMGNLLSALEFYLAPPQEVAIVGNPDREETARLVAALRQCFLPNAVVALADPDDPSATKAIPLLQDRGLVHGEPAAYVCRGFVCELPVTNPDDLIRQLSPNPAEAG